MMANHCTELSYNKQNELVKIADWSFSASEDNTHFTVCRNRISKTVMVKKDHEFAFKLQKTQVKAAGGANGLSNFVYKALSENFADCLAWKILNWCFYDCRAVENSI